MTKTTENYVHQEDHDDDDEDDDDDDDDEDYEDDGDVFDEDFEFGHKDYSYDDLQDDEDDEDEEDESDDDHEVIPVRKRKIIRLRKGPSQKFDRKGQLVRQWKKSPFHYSNPSNNNQLFCDVFCWGGCGVPLAVMLFSAL